MPQLLVSFAFLSPNAQTADLTDACYLALFFLPSLPHTLILLPTPQSQARLEQKRLEHERQRELQKKAFEEQVSPDFTAVDKEVVHRF